MQRLKRFSTKYPLDNKSSARFFPLHYLSNTKAPTLTTLLTHETHLNLALSFIFTEIYNLALWLTRL